jgi:cellobiose phosphorylase
VLDHLLEAVDHVLGERNPTTGLVRIHDGDWNDAIGLIETSSMVLQQLYWALSEMALLAAHLPRAWQKHPAVRRLHPSRYRALMDELHDTFVHRCVQRHPDGRLRIVHGFTKEGRTVGGFWDSDGVVDKATAVATLGRHHSRWAAPFVDAEGRTLYKLHARWVDPECRRLQGLPDEAKRLFLVERVSSTPLSFAVLSGILRHEPGRGDAAGLEAAIVRDAQLLDSPYGWKTFSRPFGRQSRELGIGRIGDLDGAENASPYIHAGLFLCQAFYLLGHEREAGAFLTKSLPLDRHRHAGQNRSLQYVPNSWGIGPNNDGASMNDFHTNAASILSRIVVEDIAGLRTTYDGIVVRPVQRPPGLVGERAAIPIEYRARLRERALRVVHEWTPGVTEREISLGGRALRLSGEAGRRGAFVPWAALAAEAENTIFVRDPLVLP